MLHDDDLWILDALLMTVQARQLDGCLVGLGTGIGEEDPVHG